MIDGVSKFGVGRRLRNELTVVMLAPADYGPAIVATGLGDVEFVPAHWAELFLPEFAGLGMYCCALHIAVPIGPDLRARVLPPHKGIVRGHGAVGIDAYDLAEIVGEVLRGREREAPAEGDEQLAVGGENEPRAEVEGAINLGLLLEDDFDVFKASCPPGGP